MAGVGVKMSGLRWRMCATLLAATTVATPAAAELPPLPPLGATAGPYDRPGPDGAVRDLAGVLTAAESRALRQTIRTLSSDTGVPVYALILDHIPSGESPANDAPLAGFLQRLFVRWGDRHPLLQDTDWGAGVVLAIAPAERRARVGFGPGWNDQTRRNAASLAPTYGKPDFRRGRYARGLDRLLHATGALMRGETLPPPPGAQWWRTLWIGGTAVAALVLVGFWHRPTGHRTLRLTKTLLALPHAALNRAAGRRNVGAQPVYPSSPTGSLGASARW